MELSLLLLHSHYLSDEVLLEILILAPLCREGSAQKGSEEKLGQGKGEGQRWIGRGEGKWREMRKRLKVKDGEEESEACKCTQGKVDAVKGREKMVKEKGKSSGMEKERQREKRQTHTKHLLIP